MDGEKIKGDTFYCLYKHEFRKYVDYDKIPAAVLNYRKGVYKVVTFDDFVRGEITYIVEKDGVYSHGKTIKEARESFIYKISNRDTSAFGNMTLDTVVSFEEAVENLSSENHRLLNLNAGKESELKQIKKYLESIKALAVVKGNSQDFFDIAEEALR